MQKSDKLFYSCFLFLLGIGVGEILHFKWYVFIIAFIALFLLFYFLKKKRLLFFILIMFVFGIFWNNALQPNVNEKHIAFYNDQYFEFNAIIAKEPDVRMDHQKLTMSPDDFQGKVLLKTLLYPEFEYGDHLKINCKLQKPEPIEEFKYDKYLSRYGIYSVCYSPQITVLEKDQGNLLVASVLKLKKYAETKLYRSLSEPQASLLSGILIGSRQGIPKKLLEQFNITGITHIIAISGFNITIIVVLLLNLLKYLSINRKKAIYLILIGLLFFVILTGMSASVVRAAIMGFLVAFAKHLGRQSNIRNVLILSAVVMVFINPAILIWDAGFQLSFLATIGLVYLSPNIEKYFSWFPKKFAIQENLIATLSAIIVTLPLILFNFHRLSLVAPLVNLLVLPIIPIVMLVGFIQLIVASFWLAGGQIVGWITWLMLSYVIKIVEIFSSFKFAAVDFRISWWMMILLYLILFWFIKKAKKKIL